MKVKAVLEVPYDSGYYRVIDFLNKNLKEKDLIFGMAAKGDGLMAITIYDTSDEKGSNDEIPAR